MTDCPCGHVHGEHYVTLEGQPGCRDEDGWGDGGRCDCTGYGNEYHGQNLKPDPDAPPGLIERWTAGTILMNSIPFKKIDGGEYRYISDPFGKTHD